MGINEFNLKILFYGLVCLSNTDYFKFRRCQFYLEWDLKQ